jgi:GNAT superfamily N-acetyltransferase
MTILLPAGCQSRVLRPHGALTPPAVSVRQAGLPDLDAMVRIGLEAMPMDPQWNWRFAHRDRFPNEYERGITEKYHAFLENRLGNWFVLLAEKPDDRVHGVLRPVAFAVWNVGNLLAALLTATRAKCVQSHLGRLDPTCFATHRPWRITSHTSDANTHPDRNNHTSKSPRRDADPERMKAWTQAIGQAKAQIFDAQLGRNYFQLQLLATRPQFQRQGAATQLCYWGIEVARRTGFAIAVFASPMGRTLYSHLGFKWCDNVRIRALGDEEDIVVAAMVYHFESVVG